MLVYWIWLAEHPELTPQQKHYLAKHFSDPEELYFGEIPLHLDPKIQKALENKDLTEAKNILRKCAQKQIDILVLQDQEYPNRLRNIPDPPLVLYYRGTLPNFHTRPLIAMVGTRKASPYGICATRRLATQISACGGLVVSGAADGVDAAAMEGALENDDCVIGVLGCGVDVVYPRSNRRLFQEVLRKGCLISEYPPESKPESWHFPQRNRIISGLADGVVVSEAPLRSGALITARYALEQGRDVFAVPGNIDMPTCAGSNGLLDEGAGIVLSGWSVMREYEALYPETVANRMEKTLKPEQAPSLANVAQTTTIDKIGIDNVPKNAYSGKEISDADLTEEEQKLLSVLGSEPKHTDNVIAESGVSTGKALGLLTKLAVKGYVVNHPGRLVSRSKRRK